MRSVWNPWLLAACAAAGFGCSGSDSTQVVTGKVTARGAIAVRAVEGADIITESRVRSNGSFTLSLPAGKHYQLQVLTWGGVQPIRAKAGTLAFDVCQPTDPWDMGGVGSGSGSAGGTGGGDGSGSGYCVPPPPIDASGNPCDPMTDPTCLPPPPCDPMTDPTCTCLPPPPPPGCDPGTGSGSDCPPPPCDPATDPMCIPPPPPGCDPGTGSGSGSGSDCPPPPPPPCDPMTDPTCPYPPPPCTDPADPTTCQDPCMTDPSQCGMGSGSGCWPPPCDPADPGCAMGSGMWPANPPGDFGCGGGSAQ